MPRDRDHGFEIPKWWRDLAIGQLAKEKKLIALGITLSELVGRAKPWGHPQLSNIAAGKANPTQQLALALSRHYGIPAPMYVAQSIEEAGALQAVHEAFVKSTKKLDAVRSGTEAQYIAELEGLEAESKRQPQPSKSSDEVSGRPRSRGPNRVR